jgi:hypothetical protein
VIRITLDVFIQKIPKKGRPRSRKQQAKVAAPLASNVASRALAACAGFNKHAREPVSRISRKPLTANLQAISSHPFDGRATVATCHEKRRPLAVLKDAAEVAHETGNTERIVHRHYKELVTESEGRAWFAVMPEAPGNIVAIKSEA